MGLAKLGINTEIHRILLSPLSFIVASQSCSSSSYCCCCCTTLNLVVPFIEAEQEIARILLFARSLAAAVLVKLYSTRISNLHLHTSSWHYLAMCE